MKGTREVRIVYSFGANVAFIVALLFATFWAAYNTHMVAGVQRHLNKAHLPIVAPAPAASPAGHIHITIMTSQSNNTV